MRSLPTSPPSARSCSSISVGQRVERVLVEPAGRGALDAVAQLVAVERLAGVVPLAHDEAVLVDPFVGREPAPAGEALAPAADRRAVFAGARIDDFVVVLAAERAAHGGHGTARRDLRARVGRGLGRSCKGAQMQIFANAP